MVARRSMAMAATSGRLVFFGGVGAAGTQSILDVSNDCWMFDPQTTTWEQVPAREPWPSARRCSGVVSTVDGLMLWGGSGITESESARTYTFLNDWWQMNLAAGQWARLRPSDDHRLCPLPEDVRPYPEPRYTPIFERVGETLLLFGGYTEDRLGKRKLNDTWLFEHDTWTQVPQRGDAGYVVGVAWPGVRYGGMSATVGDQVFVFGGFSDSGDHNDLWQFDLRTRRWALVAPASSSSSVPLPRYCAAMTAADDRLLLFGGRSRRFPKLGFNDLWAFHLRTCRWERIHGTREPHVYDATTSFPGYHAKASSGVLGRSWYHWGGEGLSGHVSDFWRFSLDDFTWELLQPARPDDPVFW